MTLTRELNDALPNQGHFFNDGKPTARMLPAGPDHAQIAASNAVMDFVMELEEKLDISIPVNMLSEVQTIGDLAKVVQEITRKDR